MGLFHRNESEANFAGGSKNVMESIQGRNDTGTLIYLDERQDFNTNSVITVRPGQQAIIVKNGEVYGVLPEGRHEIKNENYPVLSHIRNMLTGGVSTFTCQVYHVQTSEQVLPWGTGDAIEIQDFFLGNGIVGVKTLLRGYGSIRLRIDALEDENYCVGILRNLMQDQSSFTTDDLRSLYEDQIRQNVISIIGGMVEDRSKEGSINGISRELNKYAELIQPKLKEIFAEYGLLLKNFSIASLTIDETPERLKYSDRIIAAAHTGSYDKAVQQELLGNISVNEGAGGIASAGAGLGMGMAAGNAFAQMATTAFSPVQPQQPQQPQHQGFGNGNRFSNGGGYTAQPAHLDPMETLSQMKKMLDAGLISQEIYDAKVKEVLSRM